MLRITVPTSETPAVFLLEGRLAGLWAKEFLRRMRAFGVGPDTRFNIEGVSDIDPAGAEALKWLNGKGAKFIANTSFAKSLCSRLKLSRVAKANLSACESGNENATLPLPAIHAAGDPTDLPACV